MAKKEKDYMADRIGTGAGWLPEDYIQGTTGVVAPYDYDALTEASVHGRFDSGAPNGGKYDSQVKSVDVVFQKIKSCIVSLSYEKLHIGNGVLIAPHIVLTARHVVEGKDISNIFAQIFHPVKQKNVFTGAFGAVESSITHDYALLYFSDIDWRGVRCSLNNTQSSALAVFRNNEGVFCHSESIADVSLLGEKISTFYFDTQNGDSGCGYFNTQGELFAYHIGREKLKAITSNATAGIPLCYAMRGKNSLLARIVNNLSFSTESPIQHLPVCKQYGYEADTEGAISATWLTSEVSRILLDRTRHTSRECLEKWEKFQFNSDENIVVDAEGVAKIKTILTTTELEDIISRCTGRGGTHGYTKEFSVAEHVSSDHLIPQAVWERLVDDGKVPSMTKDDLPAISIPDGIHKKLRTTIDPKFQTEIYNLCKAGKYDQAIYKCLNDYHDKGITLKKTEDGILDYLKWFVNKGYFVGGVANTILKNLSLGTPF